MVVTERVFRTGEIGIVEQGEEGTAVDVRRRRQAAEPGQRRVEIDALHQRIRGTSRTLHFRRTHNEDGLQGSLETGVLAEDAMLAQVPPVVTPEYDDCIVVQAEGFDLVEDTADLGVHETDAGGITMFQVPSIGGIFQPCLWMMAILLHQLKTRVIGRRIRRLAPIGLRNLFRIIEIEILLRRPKRQMGFYKSNGKEKGLIP